MKKCFEEEEEVVRTMPYAADRSRKMRAMGRSSVTLSGAVFDRQNIFLKSVYKEGNVSNENILIWKEVTYLVKVNS